MSTNPFIKHLLAFGKEIKKNGKLLESINLRTSYKWHVEPYDFLFKMYEKYGVQMYEIAIILNLRHGKILPLGSIHFTDKNIFPFLSNKDLVEIQKIIQEKT